MSRNPLDFIKPVVRRAAAYTLEPYTAEVKINQNENPFDVPESVKRRAIERALSRSWSRYPDFAPTELLQALATHTGWRADGILAGNGSNELIEATLRVTVGAGTRVVIPEPTFSLYALLTSILDGAPVRVDLRPDYTFDVGALLEAEARHEAAVTIVCSPNNPTGSAVSAEEIGQLCDAVRGLVVLDEAYGEFAGWSAVGLLAAHPNLIVLKTFSKAMAMGGLRVGYLLAAPEIVKEIDKARLPYNLNFFSQAAALAALEDDGLLRDTVARLVAERERVFAQLVALPGVHPYPSQANFILFSLDGASPRGIFDALRERGVLVRDVSSGKRLTGCLRVSIGTERENERFLVALQEALVTAPAGAKR